MATPTAASNGLPSTAASRHSPRRLSGHGSAGWGSRSPARDRSPFATRARTIGPCVPFRRSVPSGPGSTVKPSLTAAPCAPHSATGRVRTGACGGPGHHVGAIDEIVPFRGHAPGPEDDGIIDVEPDRVRCRTDRSAADAGQASFPLDVEGSLLLTGLPCIVGIAAGTRLTAGSEDQCQGQRRPTRLHPERNLWVIG